MERSVYSGRYCFLESLNENNGITNAEYNLMDRWFKVLSEQLTEKIRPDLISKSFVDVQI